MIRFALLVCLLSLLACQENPPLMPKSSRWHADQTGACLQLDETDVRICPNSHKDNPYSSPFLVYGPGEKKDTCYIGLYGTTLDDCKIWAEKSITMLHEAQIQFARELQRRPEKEGK